MRRRLPAPGLAKPGPLHCISGNTFRILVKLSLPNCERDVEEHGTIAVARFPSSRLRFGGLRLRLSFPLILTTSVECVYLGTFGRLHLIISPSFFVQERVHHILAMVHRRVTWADLIPSGSPSQLLTPVSEYPHPRLLNHPHLAHMSLASPFS
jgi:hypothetical protein